MARRPGHRRLQPGPHRHLALTADGSTLTAAINGTTVGSASDASYGTQLDQNTSSGATYQQWSINPAGNGAYTLANVNSGQLADVNGASTAQNATVIQWPANSGANQQWYLTLAY